MSTIQVVQIQLAAGPRGTIPPGTVREIDSEEFERQMGGIPYCRAATPAEIAHWNRTPPGPHRLIRGQKLDPVETAEASSDVETAARPRPKRGPRPRAAEEP